jgi:PAS domain S-box-containing protein
MEQETSGSACLLAAIVNSSSDAIISRTLDGTVTSWNPAATALLGYSSEEVIGEPIRRFIPTDRQDEDDRFLAKIKAGERVETYSTVRLDKSGRPIDVSLTISPIWDTNGKTIGASDIVRSISSQDTSQNLHEHEELLRRFVDQAPILMIMLDRNMNHLACSRRFIENFKLEGVPIIGRSHYEVIPEIPERWKEAHRRGLVGEVSCSDEDAFVGADGCTHWFQWEIRPWLKSDQTVGGITIMGEDVTEKVEAARALRESQERLQRFVENAPAAICMMDRNMVHLACSRRWLEGVGLPEAEIIGRNHYEVLPNLPETWKEAHRRGLAGEVVGEEEEACGKLPDGALRWARWEVRPWFMVDQTIGGITVMFEDVTERVEIQRALRESEERLRFALEAGEVGTWEASVETGVIGASDRAYALIDLPPGTPLSYDMLVARVHPDDRARVDEAFRRTFETGQPFQTEWRLLLTDGSVRWLDTRGERRSLAGKQVVGGLIQDITVRINQKETAERAAKAESEFLSNMSHELRTPMHAILGYAEICTDAVKEGEIDGIEKYLNNVTSAGKRLLDLLNNLLELAKLEDGRVEYKFKRTDLKDVVEHTLMELDPLIKAKNQRISVSLGNHTDALIDRTHLIQVLVNLVSNAIKFSAAGSHIGIDLSDDRLDGGDQIRCSVTDEGPGIPDDELRAVFDKFVQSKKTKTGKGGTGLGLAICDHIIKAHGGKIWAENAKPHGALFTFTIPRDHDPGGAASTWPSQKAAADLLANKL